MVLNLLACAVNDVRDLIGDDELQILHTRMSLYEI